MASTGTAVVDITSDLVRKKWITEGLIAKKANSFWDKWTGSSSDSVIYQQQQTGTSDGHTMEFDFSGFLSSEGFRGLEQAFGKGEQKRKFSDKLIIEQGRYAVDNGTAFDGVTIGDLSITQHTDSRDKLGDLWVRAKDQTIFDTLQGYKDGASPTHVIRPNDRANIGALTNTDVMSMDFLKRVEQTVTDGRGFTSGDDRMPMQPFMGGNIDGAFLFVIDNAMYYQLTQDPDFINIMANADVRGQENRLIKGYLGTIGQMVIVKAPNFFGSSSSNKQFKTGVERAGLRTIDASGTYNGTTTAQTGVIASRGLVLGRSAMMYGVGKLPDYKFQESQDFAIKSESALEVWTNSKKVQLMAENDDYVDGKIAGIDFGILAVETYNRTIA